LNPTYVGAFSQLRTGLKEPGVNRHRTLMASIVERHKGAVEQRRAHPGLSRSKNEKNSLEGNFYMESARYLRDQAFLCLEMARHMSDPRAAKAFRASAGQYFTRATGLEEPVRERSKAADLAATERQEGR
jgi:hypothetical protein